MFFIFFPLYFYIYPYILKNWFRISDFSNVLYHRILMYYTIDATIADHCSNKNNLRIIC